MSTPAESAELILKLYDLRREETMRKARAWFVADFNPETFDEVIAAVSGEKSAWLRMVVGYWDMACSLVVHGAIDRDMFIASGGELLTAFAKVEPFLPQLRQGNEDFLKHMEQVAREFPNAETRLPQLRERFRAMAAAKSEPAAAEGETA